MKPECLRPPSKPELRHKSSLGIALWALSCWAKPRQEPQAQAPQAKAWRMAPWRLKLCKSWPIRPSATVGCCVQCARGFTWTLHFTSFFGLNIFWVRIFAKAPAKTTSEGPGKTLTLESLLHAMGRFSGPSFGPAGFRGHCRPMASSTAPPGAVPSNLFRIPPVVSCAILLVSTQLHGDRILGPKRGSKTRAGSYEPAGLNEECFLHSESAKRPPICGAGLHLKDP